MKTLVVKENQVVYQAAIDESLREGEPVILERDGRPIAVLVPIEEYETFRAWQAEQQADKLHDWPDDRTLEEVVADVKGQGPGSPNVRKPTASLAELLANSPRDPDFDLEEWQREWAKVEAKIETEDAAVPGLPQENWLKA